MAEDILKASWKTTAGKFKYPTRNGVAPHESVPALDPETLADVDQSALADLGPTRTLLQELGLQ